MPSLSTSYNIRKVSIKLDNIDLLVSYENDMNHVSSLTQDYPALSHHRPQSRYQLQWSYIYLILTPNEFYLLLALFYLAMYLAYALAHS